MAEVDLRRSDADLFAARRKAREHCGPFTTYFAEYFSENKVYCRLILNLTSDNTYKTIKCELDFYSTNGQINVSELGHFKHLHIAKEKLEEEATYLEQNGFMFVDELEKLTFDIKSTVEKLHENKLSVCSLSDFITRNRNREVYVQPVDKGMHMFFLVDEMGSVWLRPIGLKENVGWQRTADSYLLLMMRDLARLDGAFGFVGEGFYDGTTILLTDIILIKDRWVNELSSHERILAFTDAVKGMGILHPPVAVQVKISIDGLRELTFKNKAVLVSIPSAKPSLSLEPIKDLGRILVTENKPLEIYLGERKTVSHYEVFDFEDLKYKGLGYLKIDINLKGLKFKVSGFKPGDISSAVYC